MRTWTIIRTSGIWEEQVFGMLLAMNSCFKSTMYAPGLYYFGRNISVPLETVRHLVEKKILFLSLFSINHRMIIHSVEPEHLFFPFIQQAKFALDSDVITDIAN